MPKPSIANAAQRIMGRQQKFVANELAAVQQQLLNQQQQLQDLMEHKKNYMQDFSGNDGQDDNIHDSQQYENQLAQIDQNIAQKQDSIANCTAKCEQKRREWVMCSRKTKVVETQEQRQRIQERNKNKRDDQDGIADEKGKPSS